MTNGPGTTARLCEWVCSTQHEDLPAEVRRDTVTLLYDQVGCMIACAALPTCQPVVDLARKLGGPEECSIVGHPLRTSVTNAALANGTIGHGDEVDSTGQQGAGHYAASAVPTVLTVGQYTNAALANGTIGHGDEVDSTGQQGAGHYAASAVPTVLTVGQYTNASGRQLVRALALGAEVAARLQNIIFSYGAPDLFYASVSGAMGAAVNAGLLLGLNPDQMEHALGLAASGACGLTSHHLEERHQTKALDRGRAAAAGVLSALLAQQGFHGPREILTTDNGFFDAFLGVPLAGHNVVKQLGENFLMRQLAYKRYPVGAPNQGPVYALLELMQSHNLKADDIHQIEVSVTRGAHHVVSTNQHPSVHMETILSLTAVYGELTFQHIHEPGSREDPRFQAFRRRVLVLIIPRPGAATRGDRLDSAVTTVHTNDGTRLTRELRYPPMTEVEIQQKFRSLAGLRLEESRVLDLEMKLKAVEAMDDVAPLVRELALS